MTWAKVREPRGLGQPRLHRGRREGFRAEGREMGSQPGLTELGYTEGDMVQPGLYKVRLRGSLGYVK